MISLVHYRINSPDVIAETIDGEAVLVNLDSGNYYSLDRVGAEIWELIASRATAEEIVQRLAGRYVASQRELEESVSQLIGELRGEDLILVDGSDGRQGDLPGAPSGLESATGKLRFEKPLLRKYSDMQDLLVLDPIHQVDDSGWPSRG